MNDGMEITRMTVILQCLGADRLTPLRTVIKEDWTVDYVNALVGGPPIEIDGRQYQIISVQVEDKNKAIARAYRIPYHR